MKSMLFPLLLLTPLIANAQSSANINNTAKVESMCTIATVQNMTFPAVDVNSAGTTSNAQGVLRVLCTKNLNYSINLGAGDAGVVTYNVVNIGQGGFPYVHSWGCQRAMKNGSQSIPYDILVGEVDNSYNTANSVYATVARTWASGPTVTAEVAKYNSDQACGTTVPALPYTRVMFTDPIAQNVVIRGRMTPPKSVKKGVYTDNLAVTISF